MIHPRVVIWTSNIWYLVPTSFQQLHIRLKRHTNTCGWETLNPIWAPKKVGFLAWRWIVGLKVSSQFNMWKLSISGGVWKKATTWSWRCGCGWSNSSCPGGGKEMSEWMWMIGSSIIHEVAKHRGNNPHQDSFPKNGNMMRNKHGKVAWLRKFGSGLKPDQTRPVNGNPTSYPEIKDLEWWSLCPRPYTAFSYRLKRRFIGIVERFPRSVLFPISNLSYW